MAGGIARELNAWVGLRKIGFFVRAGALLGGGGVLMGVPGGGLSFVATAHFVERVGQRHPVRIRTRVRHAAHGVELFERRVVVAGVLFEQRQLVAGVIEIGL